MLTLKNIINIVLTALLAMILSYFIIDFTELWTPISLLLSISIAITIGVFINQKFFSDYEQSSTEQTKKGLISDLKVALKKEISMMTLKNLISIIITALAAITLSYLLINFSELTTTIILVLSVSISVTIGMVINGSLSIAKRGETGLISDLLMGIMGGVGALLAQWLF